ncbi:hypothetical protein PG661_04795 [Riemerella anatipestifer]|nr:hypothetical protein [Riemerella anatipestifer]MDY3353343.1 hypothetical protein [Riemerella anatipestifer]
MTFLSCQTSENKGEPKDSLQNEEILIIGDIDTAKVISQLAIKESGSRLDLSNEKIGSLADNLDTLELTYYFGFCDCQRWIISEIHNRALTENANLDKLDPRGQIEFNLDKHGYYIEAANKELEINWRTAVNGTTIRFIGREYIDKRLPKDGEFTVRNPPKGKVFRYYSYQILRPYQIWGPHKLTEIDKETGDSIKKPTILTVK